MIPRAWISVIVVLFAPTSHFGQTTPPYQTDFPPEEFAARWKTVFEQIGDRAIAIVAGAPQANGFLVPRQSNEFYHLCGIETPHSYLILDGRDRQVTLLLPPRDPRMESAEGQVLSADDAESGEEADRSQCCREHQGDDRGLDGEAGRGTRTRWCIHRSHRRRATRSLGLSFEVLTPPSPGTRGMAGPRVRPNSSRGCIRVFPRMRCSDLTPILDVLRSVKIPREIALIRRASQLAGRGLIEAMKSTRPGAFEYQLDAVARYAFLVNGARLEGYRSITASGIDNIWNMHYYRNTGQLKSRDLVLMDFAPEYHYYTSDIARVWPVNGKYSPEQRELLQFVLDYRNCIMKRIRPGISPRTIRGEAKTAMEEVFRRTRFSKQIYERAAHRLVDTSGGVFSHPVGMAVHDDGDYSRGVLQPGHVLSIDPQLRVPEERIYLRYEDVISITHDGYENFTAFLPTELDEIEKLVGQGGMLQQFPSFSGRDLAKP